MHNIILTLNTSSSLRNRFLELQLGPADRHDAISFYCGHETCPWNSLDAIEAELTRREVESVR